MNSLMTFTKIKKFVDIKALAFIAIMFVGFCSFFTLAYWISFMNFN